MGTAWSEASVASSTVGPRTTTPTPGARNPCQDFDTLGIDDINIRGIWSNGTTLWGVDRRDDKAYAYNLATKARDASKDISLDNTKTWNGIASDGATLWAGQEESYTTIFAYNLATGARDSTKDLTMSGDNDYAYHLWTDGGHLWVHDKTNKKIYAYDLTDNNAQDTSKTISLGNKDSYRGIWSDGTTLWIMEESDRRVYAYTLASGARDSAKDYTSLDSLNANGFGLWSDGTTLWIGDWITGKIYAYHSISPVATPAAPTTVNAYRGFGFVDAEWNAVTGATGYNVEHYHPWNMFLQGREWVRVATNTTATGIRVPRSNWAGDVIRVQAVKQLNTLELASGWTHSDPVPQVTTYPTAPSGLAASRISAGEIVVGWTQCDAAQSSCNSGTPITGFHVDVSSDGGASWSRSKTLTSYTSGAGVSVTQGVTSSVDRVRVTVDTRVKDASAAVSVPTVSLTASSVTSSGATLTLSGHTGGWWYEGGKVGGTLGACTSVPSGNSVSLTGLDSNDFYDYTAYSGADCEAADLIATERFSTKKPGGGVSFTATNVTWNSARLTLSGHTGGWWYKGFDRGGDDEGSCAAGPADFVLDLLGLSGNTAYTYRAYSDSGCGTQIASATLRTQNAPALTAGSITDSGATLTLANHAGDWWYDGGSRADGDGSCRKGGADYSVDLTGLTARTAHTYNAYTDSGCIAASRLDTVGFTTLAGLAVSEVTATGATLTISGYTGRWWYMADTGPDATCQGPVAADTATETLTGLTGLTAYVYSAYSARRCTTLLATASSFTTPASVSNLGAAATTNAPLIYDDQSAATAFTTGANSGGYTLRSVTVKFRAVGNNAGTLTTAIHAVSGGNPASSATHTLGENNPTGAGEYTFTCSGGCSLDADETYFLVLKGTGTSSARSFTWDTTASTSETNTPSDFGWSIADKGKTHASGAWGDVTDWTGIFEVTAVPDPSLDASSVTATGATLTIAHHGGVAWYYKHTNTGATCDGPVAAGTSTKDLTSLTAGTSYTYSAYSDSSCTSGNLLATAASFTTPVTVSTLNGALYQRYEVGNYQQTQQQSAQAFTVGSNTAGYTLSSIAIQIDSKIGSPTDLEVTLHRASGSNPDTTSDGRLAILDGNDSPDPSSTRAYTYNCSGSGCNLQAGWTYFVLMKAPSSPDTSYYYVDLTRTAATTQPSNNGWSTASRGREHYFGAWYQSQGAVKIKVTAVPK